MMRPADSTPAGCPLPEALQALHEAEQGYADRCSQNNEVKKEFHDLISLVNGGLRSFLSSLGRVRFNAPRSPASPRRQSRPAGDGESQENHPQPGSSMAQAIATLGAARVATMPTAKIRARARMIDFIVLSFRCLGLVGFLRLYPANSDYS